jgi:hypothetical protein
VAKVKGLGGSISDIGKKPSTTPGKTTTTPSKTTGVNPGFILIWAYPEYQPKIDGKSMTAQIFGDTIRFASGGGQEGTYGKLGHGGAVVVKSDGQAISYEFGRYPGAKEGFGKVLTDNLGKIGKIQNGQLLNPEEIATAARKASYPPGPTMSMTVAVVKLPNPTKAMEYANVKEREYSALDFAVGDDANCGTFARDVAEAGGVDVGAFCFPTPIAVVNKFKGQADKFFTI